MKVLKINLNNISKGVIEEVKMVIANGGIVIHPTDTCYGIAADIRNSDATKKVYDFKKRSTKKHLSVIVSDRKMFEEYGNWSTQIDDIIGRHKNKMFSFVVKRTDLVSRDFNNGIDNIAIQMPKNNFSLEMLKAFGNPLTATSANISNMPSVYSIEDLMLQITDELVLPDLIIDAGILPRNKPSTIVRVTGDKIEILRP